MKVSILDAQKTLFEGVAAQVIMPAIGGELSILDDHEYIFIALRAGVIRLKTFASSPGRGTVIHIAQGVARMRNNELVVLVE